MSESAVKLERLSDLGFLNLRGDPDNREFTEAAQQVLGLTLPVAPNTTEGKDTRVFWLGPNEWLCVGATGIVDEYQKSLGEALLDQFAAVNDLSGGLVSYRLSGEHVRELLATGCTLDLHPTVFRPGCCAQTSVAKAAVLLSITDQDESFDVVIRRSFADYLWQWLLRAGRDFQIEVT
jgi:sarcosine oxidase subunit gamma